MFKVDYDFHLLFSVLLLILIYFVIDWYRKSKKLPPGPQSLPFFGYLPLLKGNIHCHLKELAEIYGNIFCFRSFNGTLVAVISNYEIAKHVMINRAEEIIGRPPQFNLLSWVDGGLGVAQAEGREWKEQRRFFIQTAGNFGFGKIEIQGTIQEMIEKLIEDLKQLSGKPFHPLFHISHVTCNVISEILLRKRIAKDDKFDSMMKGLNEFVSFFSDYRLFTFGAYLRFWMKFTKQGRRAEKNRDSIKRMVGTIVDEHIKQFDPHNIRDFVDAYYHHMKNLEEKGQLRDSTFSEKRLYAIVFNMFLEGTESVSAATSGLLFELSQHIEVQQKCQEELDNEVGRNRLPSWQDRIKLPYVCATILELFRTRPPFNVGTAHSNFEDFEINGYRIPKRSVIVVNFYALHNDPDVYPEPSKFKPERFLDVSGKLIKQKGVIAFGMGKRVCLGEPLAQMEVVLILTSLMQNFTIYPEGENIRVEIRK